MNAKIYEKKLAKAVIARAIKDLGGGDAAQFNLAQAYIESPQFKSHCRMSGFPDRLFDSLITLAALSPVQRKVSSKQITKVLREDYADD